jgi:RHS repeat-associated protein
MKFAFGNLTASTGPLVNPFRNTARESDTETGLYYYRARYYDQTAGRFLSEDPLRFDGAERNPNLYWYVLNSPTNVIDPLGLWPWPPVYPGYDTPLQGSAQLAAFPSYFCLLD